MTTSRFPSTRTVMATPAILLFVATCVAQFISVIKGDNNVIDQNNNGLIRGATHKIVGDSSLATSDWDEDYVEVDHRRRSHHKKHSSSDDKKKRKKSKKSDDDDDHEKSDDSFDFYVFSMTYQPEFCESQHQSPEGCHHPKEIWDRLTIHGLWPNNNDGSYPQSCSDEKFDLSSLEQIRDELEEKWPNIKALPSSSLHGQFWEHEWSKHGTCTGLSQLEYFSHALTKLIPTPSMVKDAEEQHSFVKKDDLLSVYGGVKSVALVCKKSYLSEVRVCHQKKEDSNVGERMECPPAILKEGSCGKEIKIASFRSGEEEELSVAVE